MKVFLQQEDGILFIKEDGGWTRDEEDAADFRTPMNAINFCYRRYLSNVCVVLSFPEEQYHMHLNLWD